MKTLFFLFAILVIVSCSNSYYIPGPNATLISNVNVVDVTTGELIKNQSVVIDSGKIVHISTLIKEKISFKNTIDGKDKFLMPGLAEMHAHIPPPSTSMERTEEILFLYLSNGITTIRGMLGDSSHLALRSRAETTDLWSPRIFTSSPSLNGNSVTTREEAKSKVTKYKKDGYDFLKIHPGIQLEVFDQVILTANEVGIPFSGHVPVDVGIRHALESQYSSIDHIDGFIEGLVPESANVNQDENGFFGYNFAPLADTNMISELVELAKNNKIWIVPTQSLFERWFAPVSAKELLEEPEMQYMQAATRRNWLRIKNQYMDDEKFNEEQWERFNEIRLKLLKNLADQGHGILMGSDAPQLFNVPGFSIHHEIDGMQNAGLSNLEILKSGTINPAKFFEMSDIFGQVKEGYVADLILLNNNPLKNLDALKEIHGVFRNGRYISKENIDLKLKIIASNVNN